MFLLVCYLWTDVDQSGGLMLGGIYEVLVFDIYNTCVEWFLLKYVRRYVVSVVKL